MTHALTLSRTEPLQGLQRFLPARDLPSVVKLLQLVFRDELEAPDLAWLKELGALAANAGWARVLLSMLPPERGLFGGFVWYDDGRVVGNVSLMRLTSGQWVIANVATHPHYRRRGIARTLMLASLEASRQSGARIVGLQVRSDNSQARDLYIGLGFARMGASTTYRGTVDLGPHTRKRPAQVAARDGTDSGFTLSEWRPGPAADVRRLLARTGALDGPWPPGTLRQSIHRRGVAGRLDDLLRGRERHGWRVMEAGRLVAVGVSVRDSSDSGPSTEIATAPEARDRVEAHLLAAATSNLAGPQILTVEVPEDEFGVRSVVEAVGLAPLRTLDRLGLSL